MDRDVHPEMLTLAREARGLTQSELARLASISQATISKYEIGLLSIADEHINRLAEVLDFPRTFFSEGERRYGFGSSCTYHRKRQSLTASEQRVLLARANLYRMRIGWLLSNIEMETDYTFLHLDLDDYGTPEQVAHLVRQTWNIHPGPIKNLVEVIEGAGGFVILDDFRTNKLDAISQWAPGVPPVFMLNRNSPWDRLRFTMAHEIGHIIMHRIPTEDMESEADRFAAEFLMPSRDISKDLLPATLTHFAQLKGYWRVAIAALIRRAYDLGKITHRQYRYLFEQLGRSGHRIEEPAPISPESPAALRDLIQELNYETSHICEVLHMHKDEYSNEFYPSERQLRLVHNRANRDISKPRIDREEKLQK